MGYCIDEFGYYDIVICMIGRITCGLIAMTGVFTVKAGPALEQREQSFTIHLNGSLPDVTPLFGPVGERQWAPDWEPRFIHPSTAGQREGAVFMTKSTNGEDRLWLLTTYQPQQGRVEYVIVIPGFTANQIKIEVVPEGEKRCKAIVTYRHSALAPEGNNEVTELDSHWAEMQRIHWEMAVNAVLAKGGAQ
ncbi:MAG TPA: hypothetical protein VGM62_01415 [Chthoniobacterales bacterium]